MVYIHKKGSISIETAISFSIVLVFITSLIGILAFYRADILLQRSVNQTCEDFSHFTPFSVAGADTVSTIINALPDNYDYSFINQLGSIFVGADVLTQGELRCSLLDLAFGEAFTDDIIAQYIEFNGSNFYCPETIDAEFEIRDNYIEVLVSYKIRTIIGLVEREVIGIIPFWGEYELFLLDDNTNEYNNNSIWQEDNFTRGTYFAQQYGANLPHTFPTISYFENGTIGTVTSIDLNRPTYSTPLSVRRRMIEQINRLSNFDGASSNINGQLYEVSSDSIRSRRIIFVVPEDSPENLLETAYSMVSYGNSCGVEVQIAMDGCSRI